ncbi:MAG: Gfo/Idh/MocA family oxidoreductase [Oscillospiraceae bacterium]|nr:Gfo/Idh/MocA family oxidoreductase [Oscillospiraceae bacterium]
MIEVGIIGAENTHSTSFATALNLPDAEGKMRYEDFQVVKAFGVDDSASQLAEKANIPHVVDSPDDFEDCDTVMITTRWGSRHYDQIIKYIRQGMHVFIDKPYTVSVDEVKQLVEEAKKSGSLICGGSACKYAPDVVALAEKIKELREKGQLTTASVNFNIFMNIEYDGFFFYAPHLIEMAFALFGSDMRSVYANRVGNTVIVIAEYVDIQVSLHFTEGVFQTACTLYTKGGIVHQPIDISTIFDEELKVFVEMLRTKEQPFPLESIIDPVVVADAIYRSYTTGEKICLNNEA